MLHTILECNGTKFRTSHRFAGELVDTAPASRREQLREKRIYMRRVCRNESAPDLLSHRVYSGLDR